MADISKLNAPMATLPKAATPAPAPAPSPAPTDDSAPNPDTFEFNVKTETLSDANHPEAVNHFNQDVRNVFRKLQDDQAGDGTFVGGSVEGGATKVYEDKRIAVVSLSEEDYAEGAAHPNNSQQSMVYDKQTGKELHLGDLFADKSAYLDKLSGAVTKSLNTQAATEKPDEDGGGVKDFAESHEGFSADDLAAFVPTKDGLSFSLPAEREGPWNTGLFEATVPWSALSPILAKDGPLQAPAH
jgi:hypothetical protein